MKNQVKNKMNSKGVFAYKRGLSIVLIVLALFTELSSQNASFDQNAIPINGADNSGFGFQTLWSIPPGGGARRNSALGWNSLYSNTSGDENTAAGAESLFSNTSGYNNSGFGVNALYGNTTGFENTALGHSALFSNISGFHNIAIGTRPLYSNTTGSYNIAIGTEALYSNTSGDAVTACGVQALYSNTSGGFNSAYGSLSMYSNSTGSENTAIGYRTLYSNTIGTQNTASGSWAMYNNTTGGANSAYGTGALNQNSTGTGNTGIGTNALFGNTTGMVNTGVGIHALNGTPGSFNSALGAFALSGSNGGEYNAASGYLALWVNSSGSSNAGFGASALISNTTGSNNCGFGFSADVGSNNLSNAAAIGNGAVVNASNKIRFGDANVTVVEGPVGYTTSDARFKSNVSEKDVKGLEFIMKLRPVVYNFETKKFTEFLTKNMPDSLRKMHLNKNFEYSTKIRQSGFIAQEVEKAALESGYNFNGVHKPNDDNDNYSLAYSQFVVPIVKAIQEQQKIIESLQTQIEEQEKINEELTKKLSKNVSTDKMSSSLEQNIPNPFSHETIIKYSLSENTSSAQLVVYDLSGKQVKMFTLAKMGTSEYTLNADDLAPGIYLYTIIADGAAFDARKMIISSN